MNQERPLGFICPCKTGIETPLGVTLESPWTLGLGKGIFI